MNKTEKTQEQINEEISKKIEEIYQRKNKDGKPTGKNFITHLLRAYFPIGKAVKVLDIPEKPMKCAITGHKLFALGELWNEMHTEEYKANFMKNLRVAFDPDSKEKIENPFSKIVNGRVVGITGQDTDTYLCQEAYECLFNWYANKILRDDKHIGWVAHDMRKKATITAIREKLPEAEDQKKIDRIEKISKHPQRATMSLGDMSALKELQEKLKQKEGNENN